MTLTMYRMEDTERIRFKLREDRRREVRLMVKFTVGFNPVIF